jgi:hypothetical protein
MPGAASGVIGATIDTAHALIHEGRMFSASVKASVGNNDIVEVLFTVPSGVYCHMRPQCRTEKISTLTIARGVTDLGTGSALPSYNRNLVSSRVSNVTTIKSGSPSTISSGGTVIWTELLSSGGSGGASGFTDEIVLAPGQSYSFKVTSNQASNDVSIGLTWYEPPG